MNTPSSVVAKQVERSKFLRAKRPKFQRAKRPKKLYRKLKGKKIS